MSFDLGNLLQQYLGGNAAAPQDATDHFEKTAQSIGPDLISQGLAAMFNSDKTPAFGQTVAQLFGQGDSTQQAGMLNQLLGSMGPQALSALLGGAGGAGLAGILGQLTQGRAAAPAVTAEQVSQLTPDQVQQLASHAEQHNPGIVEKMSGFYAEHPALVKSLGSAALAIVMTKMAQSRQS